MLRFKKAAFPGMREAISLNACLLGKSGPRQFSLRACKRGGVFFEIHDPTTLNRQGNDAGTQYRSAVFYHSAEQKAEAEKAIAAVNKEGAWGAPVVTELAPASKFWIAEQYHQEYFARNPGQGY